MCGESKMRSAGAGCSQMIEKARFVRTLYRNIDVMPRILYRVSCPGQESSRLCGDKEAQRGHTGRQTLRSARRGDTYTRASSALEPGRSTCPHAGPCTTPPSFLSRTSRPAVHCAIPRRGPRICDESTNQRFGDPFERKAFKPHLVYDPLLKVPGPESSSGSAPRCPGSGGAGRICSGGSRAPSPIPVPPIV
jgi:hypothetical protein